MIHHKNLYFAFKIKDGLFIGDYKSCNEKDFLISNKITGIVNCGAQEIKPNNLNIGIALLNFDWLDNDEQVILDEQDQAISTIYQFITRIQEQCESVLICSVRGQSRALTIVTAFIMQKYKWSLFKTLEFMNSKRSDFEIRANFLKQLLQYEARLSKQIADYNSKSWKDYLSHKLEDLSEEPESELIRNTYLNSQIVFLQQDNNCQKKQIKQQRKNRQNIKGQESKVKWAQQIFSVISDDAQAVIDDLQDNQNHNQKQLQQTQQNTNAEQTTQISIISDQNATIQDICVDQQPVQQTNNQADEQSFNLQDVNKEFQSKQKSTDSMSVEQYNRIVPSQISRTQCNQNKIPLPKNVKQKNIKVANNNNLQIAQQSNQQPQMILNTNNDASKILNQEPSICKRNQSPIGQYVQKCATPIKSYRKSPAPFAVNRQHINNQLNCDNSNQQPKQSQQQQKFIAKQYNQQTVTPQKQAKFLVDEKEQQQLQESFQGQDIQQFENISSNNNNQVSVNINLNINSLNIINDDRRQKLIIEEQQAQTQNLRSSLEEKNILANNSNNKCNNNNQILVRRPQSLPPQQQQQQLELQFQQVGQKKSLVGTNDKAPLINYYTGGADNNQTILNLRNDSGNKWRSQQQNNIQSSLYFNGNNNSKTCQSPYGFLPTLRKGKISTPPPGGSISKRLQFCFTENNSPNISIDKSDFIVQQVKCKVNTDFDSFLNEDIDIQDFKNSGQRVQSKPQNYQAKNKLTTQCKQIQNRYMTPTIKRRYNVVIKKNFIKGETDKVINMGLARNQDENNSISINGDDNTKITKLKNPSTNINTKDDSNQKKKPADAYYQRRVSSEDASGLALHGVNDEDAMTVQQQYINNLKQKLENQENNLGGGISGSYQKSIISKIKNKIQSKYQQTSN